MNFKNFEVINNNYWIIDNEGNQQIQITNCYIVDFIREIEPNGLIKDNYIIKWSNGEIFEGNKSKIITDLTNSGIFFDRKNINQFIDNLFASNLAEIKSNIKGTYLNQSNIQNYDIDRKKLKDAVELYNSIIEFIPFEQKNLCKSMWVVPVHYILKTTAPVKRGLIYGVVTNGVTGSGKSFLTNLHKIMFEFKYNAPSFEDIESFGSYPSVRNKIASQGGFIILDEMDNVLINKEYFNDAFRSLIKSVIKIYVPNVSDKEQQGANTDYYYLGTPIINLNSEVILEDAEKERVYYFNMVESCNISDLQIFTKKDMELLREIGKAYYNVVKDLDFSTIETEIDARKLIIDAIETKYDVKFNLIMKTPITESENDNRIYEKLLNNIQYHCRITYIGGETLEERYKCVENPSDCFDWIIETSRNSIIVNSKLFNKYISKLANDNTINYTKTCEDIGFPNKKTVKWYDKRTKGYRFENIGAFLDALNFNEYLNPKDEEDKKDNANDK